MSDNQNHDANEASGEFETLTSLLNDYKSTTKSDKSSKPNRNNNNNRKTQTNKSNNKKDKGKKKISLYKRKNDNEPNDNQEDEKDDSENPNSEYLHIENDVNSLESAPHQSSSSHSIPAIKKPSHPANNIIKQMMDGSSSDQDLGEDSDLNSEDSMDESSSLVSHISIERNLMPEVVNNNSDLNHHVNQGFNYGGLSTAINHNNNNNKINNDKSNGNSDEEQSQFSNIEFPDVLPEVPKNISPNARSSTRSSTTNSINGDLPRSIGDQINKSQPTTIKQFPSIQPKVQRKSVPGQNFGIAPLTVVTYNVWYNRKHMGSRTRGLIEHLMNSSKYKPDLINLQEVTAKSYSLIETALNDDYFLFEILGEPPNVLPYSNLIALNRSTIEIVDETLTGYDFNSQMGRKLLVCQVMHKSTGIKFHILNAHLESFQENWSYRKDQMESIIRLIKGEKIRNFILVGDFNICNPTEPIETQIRLSGYSDAWVDIGSPESLKFTYDHSLNDYVKEKTALQLCDNGPKQNFPKKPSRLDRILYKFKDHKIKTTKMKFLGVVKPNPSDHFGLLVEFMLKSSSSSDRL
tara:strand:- start:2978 stop:4705 length:1728 start_codon:yes stop_codon:yes gene_type:complete